MKYTVLGFSQPKLVDLGLDLNDALILRWFVDFYSTGKMLKVSADGVEYARVSYKSMLNDIPIIGVKSHDVLRRRMKKIVTAGLFESYTLQAGGTFPCYRLSDMYEKLIARPDLNADTPTQKSEGSYSKVGGGPTQKSEQSNPSISNQSIKSKTSCPQSTTDDETEFIKSGGTKEKKKGGGATLKEFLETGKRGYDPKKEHSFETQHNFTDHELALCISKWFLKRTGRVKGRKLASKPSADPFIKLFKLGIDPQTIVDTCNWLTGPNLQLEYSFVIQSGNTLYRKWDDVCSGMERGRTKKTARSSYVKEGRIYFPNEPKSAGGQEKFRIATDEDIDEAKKNGTFCATFQR